MEALRIVGLVWLLAGCGTEQEAPEPIVFPETIAAPVDEEITVLPVVGLGEEAFPWVEPTAVGVELDAIIRQDGSLEGYTFEGVTAAPRIYLHLAGDAWFAGDDEEDPEHPQSCYAWGWWQPTSSGDLPTTDGAEFFVTYRGHFALEDYDCDALLDPAIHGEAGEDFMARFDGMEIGIGFAPLTQGLQESWSEPTLQTWGPAMLASYVALPASDSSFVAQDLSTTFAIAVDPDTDAIATDPAGDLVTVDITDATPETGLPDVYAYTVATFYVTLDSLGL